MFRSGSPQLTIEVRFVNFSHTSVLKKERYNDHFSAQKTTLKVPGEGSGVYGLVGVVLHKQLTSGLGHYTAFVCSSSDKWYHANDSQVQCCIHYECTQRTSEHIDSISGDPS